MKRIFFIAFVIFSLFISTESLHAQQKFSFGIQGGLGAATAHNNHKGKNENASDVELGIPKIYPVLSHQYGLYLSYKLNDIVGIAFEPGIIRKGYGTKSVEDNEVTFNRRKMDYLQLPLLAELYLEESITFTVGPEFGYLLNAKMNEKDLPVNNKFDIGIQIGAYYSLKKYLDIGLKAGASITRIDKYYLTNGAGDVLTGVSRRHMYTYPFIRVKL